MSYDLAVWDGPPPASEAEALAEFQRRYAGFDAREPANPAIAALVSDLLARFPELSDDDSEDTPWATGPLLDEAAGAFCYLALTYPGSAAHLEEVVAIIGRHGLVCYDPQTGTVLAPEASMEGGKGKGPLYPRLLHLQHVHPNGWQRAVLGEGMAAVGGLLALADLASAWSILVLPVAVGVVVKAHDLLAGQLQR